MSTPAAPSASAAPSAPTEPIVAPPRIVVRSRHRPWLHQWLGFIGRPLLRLILDVRVREPHYVPPAGPVIVAGNHRGLVDGPVVAVGIRRPTTFLVKSELFVGPLARVLGWLGQIPVHRGRPDRAALQQARAVLAAGGLLGIFPEGTRGAGSLDEVQHGVAYLAVRAGCPIVPVACLGTEGAWPRGARLPRWRTGVDVVFGPPFTVTVTGDPRSRRAVAEAAEQIRVALAAHVRAVEGDRR